MLLRRDEKVNESTYNVLLDAVELHYWRTERQLLSDNDQVFRTTSKSDENHKNAHNPQMLGRSNSFLQLDSFLIISKFINGQFLYMKSS